MSLLAIDPGLRNNGLVWIDSRDMLPSQHWTLRCKGSLLDLVPLVDQWIDTYSDPADVAIELPPPRIHGKTYQIEPALAVGVWVHALGCQRHPITIVPSRDWHTTQLGPRKHWPKGNPKLMAALVCRGLGVDLPNEHVRDAYLMGRHVLKLGRTNALLAKAAPGEE